VLEHIDDLRPVMCELRRVCKAGGSAFISDVHPAIARAGVAASFRDPDSGQKIFPRGYRHQISDYVAAAAGAGFKVAVMAELPVDRAVADAVPRAVKYLGMTMLLMLSLVAA
jgi:2-polyprenyl-3-methyl-5-hydroxy-6-metoxy-1,4-benzoquinol methylase